MIGDPGLYRSRDEALRIAGDLNSGEHLNGYFEVHPVTAFAIVHIVWGPTVARPTALVSEQDK